MNEVTDKGAFVIAAEEGIVPFKYLDAAGVLTWGIGHTAQAGAPDPADKPAIIPDMDIDAEVLEAWSVFRRDLAAYTAGIEQMFGQREPLKPHERDGLVSWHFNTGGAYKSSAVKHWLNGDKERAVRIIQTWNKVTKNGQKVVNPVLVKRREREARMILRGEYPDATLNVWLTDGNLRVVWEAIDSYDYGEWLSFLGRKFKPPSGGVNSSLAAAIAAAIAGLYVVFAGWADKLTELIMGFFG